MVSVAAADAALYVSELATALVDGEWLDLHLECRSGVTQVSETMAR